MAVVVRQGHVVYRRSVGLADVEHQVPVSPQTRFLLGSVTKPFTAIAVMQLVERGRLAYDDPLRKFFPEFPPYGDTITVRHLLNHTAGLTEYEELFVREGLVDSNWPRSLDSPRSEFEPTAKDALRLLARQPTLRFPPGSRYEYSNSGYMLLAQIVEQASGVRFAEYLRTFVFRRAGMSQSLLYDERRPVVPNRAKSYSRDSTGIHEIDYTPFDAIYGEDNIYTTGDDMVRWFQAVEGHRLVKRESLEAAWRSGRTTSGDTTGYGFGWRIGSMLGPDLVTHGGSWRGFRTHVLHFPRERLTVILLGNYAEFLTSWLAPQIAWVYLAGRAKLPTERPVAPKVLASLVGRYRLGPSLLTLSLAADRLWLTGPVIPRSEVALTSDTAGFVRENPAVGLTFEPDSTGTTVALTVRFPDGRFRAARVP